MVACMCHVLGLDFYHTTERRRRCFVVLVQLQKMAPFKVERICHLEKFAIVFSIVETTEAHVLTRLESSHDDDCFVKEISQQKGVHFQKAEGCVFSEVMRGFHNSRGR
jgi:hypothetical protein